MSNQMNFDIQLSESIKNSANDDKQKNKLTPIRSIKSAKDYKRLHNEYLNLAAKNYDDKKSQDRHALLLIRYELALKKGVRKSNYTAPSKKKKRK